MTPKSLGEIISNYDRLNNGDGISWFTPQGEYRGALVNGVQHGRIITSDGSRISPNTEIHRTSDIQFSQKLAKSTASRKIAIDISLDHNGISAKDERGVEVRLPLECTVSPAKTPQNHSNALLKFGNTIYSTRSFYSTLSENIFIPASELTATYVAVLWMRSMPPTWIPTVLREGDLKIPHLFIHLPILITATT